MHNPRSDPTYKLLLKGCGKKFNIFLFNKVHKSVSKCVFRSKNKPRCVRGGMVVLEIMMEHKSQKGRLGTSRRHLSATVCYSIESTVVYSAPYPSIPPGLREIDDSSGIMPHTFGYHLVLVCVVSFIFCTNEYVVVVL